MSQAWLGGRGRVTVRVWVRTRARARVTGRVSVMQGGGSSHSEEVSIVRYARYAAYDWVLRSSLPTERPSRRGAC